MRIFIGIPLSKQLYPKVSELQKQFFEYPVRWLNYENLHITLVPPQEITQINLAQLLEKLDNIESRKPFTIRFDNFSAGPNTKLARLLWATGKSTPVELIRLKKELEKILRYRPDRKLTLHTTLARFNRENLLAEPRLSNISQTLHWSMLVDQFVLFESKLTAEGADYSVIKRFTFYD